MDLGSLTLACLLMTANAELPEVWHLPDRRFSIPVKIQPERQKEIRELLLYASRDRGKTWELVARTTPEQTAFPFVAPDDGPYWFKVAVVNTRGDHEPRDILQAAVGQRIQVDTAKPDVRFTNVTRQGPNVVIQWTAQDTHPDPSTMKIEYRTPQSPPGLWTPVPNVQPGANETSFVPGSESPLSLRLTMKDQAGNEGVATHELAGQGGVMPNNDHLASNSLPTVPGPVAPTPGPTTLPPEPLPPGPTPGTVVGGYPPAVPTVPLEQPSAPLGAVPGHTGALPAMGPSPIVREPTTPGTGRTPPGTVEPVVVGSTGVGGATRLGSGSPLPRPMLPRKIINQLQAKLDFEVTDYGPSGLGGVDIYLTIDGGRAWELVKANATPEYPPLGDQQLKQPVIGSVTLNLPREGVTYGVSLVVKSRAGLGEAPPKAGEAPQMLIEVDTTMPEAELFAPEADPNNPDALLLRWTARDKKLATNPITIEWADSPQGPWNFIGAGKLPNSNRYSWQLPRDIPPQAYLKLTVRDAAGNIAIAQTPKPILLDVKKPKSRIIGLTTNGQ